MVDVVEESFDVKINDMILELHGMVVFHFKQSMKE